MTGQVLGTIVSHWVLQQKDGVVVLVCIIHYKAQRMQPVDSLADEVALQILNDCDSLKHLKVWVATVLNYCHFDSIHNFLDYESINHALLSTLMIYIRFVDGGTGLGRNHFLSVTALEGNSAWDIFETSVAVLESKGLDPKNIISLGSDGASIMIGQRAGVGTIQNHTQSHIWVYGNSVLLEGLSGTSQLPV